ncbi:MAG TPA: hypothetical protein VFX28_02640, partial [Methylomirabilota bacterium]|nr:hypothetical protein [Methylomirabilota bacterium]
RIDPTALAMTFTQRWSFPAEYGGRTRGGVASELASADAWARWARYFRDRTSAGTPRAVEGVAVFPQALEASLPATRASDVLSIAVTPEAGAAGR